MNLNNLVFPLFYNLLGIIKISLMSHLINSSKTCVLFSKGKLKVQGMYNSRRSYKRSLADIIKHAQSSGYCSLTAWFPGKDGSALIPFVCGSEILSDAVSSASLFLSSAHTEFRLYVLILDPHLTMLQLT